LKSKKQFQLRRGGRKFGTRVPVVPLGLNSILSVSPAAKAAGYFQPPLGGWGWRRFSGGEVEWVKKLCSLSSGGMVIY